MALAISEPSPTSPWRFAPLPKSGFATAIVFRCERNAQISCVTLQP